MDPMTVTSTPSAAKKTAADKTVLGRRSLFERGRRGLLPQVVGAAVVLFAVGFWAPNAAGPELLAVLTVVLCYAMFALGTNVLIGWSGMVTFGQAAFFGCGAYTVALTRNLGWSMEQTLAVALAASAVLGYVAYWFMSHYTHIAFAMLTLVFGQFAALVVSGTRKLGATDGFGGILRQPFFGTDVITDQEFWWVAFYITLVAIAAYWWLYRRVLALRMFGGREDAGRLETLGYNVRQLRACAGAVSGLLCGAGGAVFASYTGAVSPTVLGFELAGAAVFMCVIGGMRYLWGPVIGATLYTLTVNYWLQSNESATMYLGALFVIIMIVLPQGLLSIVATVRDLVRRQRRGAARTSA